MRLRTIHWIVIWPNFFCVRDEICCVPNYFLPHPPSKLFPLLPLPSSLLPSLLSLLERTQHQTTPIVSLTAPSFEDRQRRQQAPCLPPSLPRFVCSCWVCLFVVADFVMFHRTCSIFSVCFDVDRFPLIPRPSSLSYSFLCSFIPRREHVPCYYKSTPLCSLTSYASSLIPR